LIYQLNRAFKADTDTRMC